MIDYFLSDRFADPPGMTEALFREELARPFDSFLCYEPPALAPDVCGPPSLLNDFVTFGSFNSHWKLSEATLDLWAGVLRRLPTSRLLIKSNVVDDPACRDSLLQRLSIRGVASSRVTVARKTPTRTEHLALYGEVDVALDTFPYCGTTTTCEALWMGVPVVTLAGKAHAARVGVSILTNVGLPELVADGPEAFERTAVLLACAVERRRALRAGLRERMKCSNLCNAREFVLGMETTYRWMWHRWCASRSH